MAKINLDQEISCMASNIVTKCEDDQIENICRGLRTPVIALRPICGMSFLKGSCI